MWRLGEGSELVRTEMERKPTTVRNGRGCLEKAMATHSSTLAWQIPWTEEVFYRNFKNYHGMTTKEYREKISTRKQENRKD